MNANYQLFVVLLIVLVATCYLVWLAKKSSSKGCGGGCDCHHKKPSSDDKDK